MAKKKKLNGIVACICVLLFYYIRIYSMVYIVYSAFQHIFEYIHTCIYHSLNGRRARALKDIPYIVKRDIRTTVITIIIIIIWDQFVSSEQKKRDNNNKTSDSETTRMQFVNPFYIIRIQVYLASILPFIYSSIIIIINVLVLYIYHCRFGG